MRNKSPYIQHYLISCSLLLGLCAVVFLPHYSSAQDTKQMDKALEMMDEKSKQAVKNRILKSRQDLENQASELGPKIKQLMEQNARGGQYSIGGRQVQGPKRHPLLDSQGVAQTSEEDYTQKDTKVLFNSETFDGCLEERQVPNAGQYFEECKKRCTPGWVIWAPGLPVNCKPCKDPTSLTDPLFECKYNQFYVSELYWPVYQSRTYPGRAMGSFDPNGGYLSGQDKSSKLEYDTVREETYDRFVDYLSDFYQKVYEKSISTADIQKAFPKEYYLASDYTGRDLDGVSLNPMETQSLHTMVYMTNANRQLSRRMRPPKADNWKGYREEDRCFFNTLPDPKKLAVSHATYNEGHDQFAFAHMHEGMYERSEYGPERGSPYGSAMTDAGPAVSKIKETVAQEWKKDSSKQPSVNKDMLGQKIEMFPEFYKKGLERIGVEQSKHLQDWLYHNFFRLYGSRNSNNMEDPLYASIAAGFSFYTLNSLDNFEPNLSDGGLRRPIYWSFYAKRPSKSSYTSTEDGVGPNKIFSIDKIQILHPTRDDGELGSSCFGPESLAQSEYVKKSGNTLDKKVDDTGYWGFQRDYQKLLLDKGIDQAHNYVREVRIAYWVKRVNCHCTICAADHFLGCSVLNTGDHPDDYFYGQQSLASTPPDLWPGGSLKDLERKIGTPAAVPQISLKTERNIPEKEKNPAPTGIQPWHGDVAISDPRDFANSLELSKIADSLFEDRDPKDLGLRGSRTIVDRLLKKPSDREANARKVGLDAYGGHATDSDAATPHSTGNGDQYEIAQQPGDANGTPGSISGSYNPLQGSDAANDIPANTGPPPFFTPPPQFDFQLICPFCQGGRTAFR